MADTILEARDVVYSYSRKGPKVLDGMCIKIDKGVKTAVLGSNGAGKSTLFSVLNALYKPQSGTVLYKGEPLSYRHKGVIKMRSEVSILFQNPNDMMFKPYVEQDVAYGPENMKLPKDEVDKRVEEALFTVGMEEYRKSPIMKLSYGQRKRVTLAGVLAMRPSVLIMDEPTAGLDPQMAYEVMEIAEQLHSSGVTVVMSSHDTDLVYSWADEIRVLGGGRCVYSGPPEDFYGDRAEVQRAGLMPPSVFSINEALSRSGAFPLEPLPRTRAQLSVKISGKGDAYGRMHVILADPETDVPGLIASSGLKGISTGVCGISARMAAESSGFKADFPYNGPENCVSKCMTGQDSVLICDPAMLGVAESSVRFIEANGYGSIETDVVNPGLSDRGLSRRRTGRVIKAVCPIAAFRIASGRPRVGMRKRFRRVLQRRKPERFATSWLKRVYVLS
ncbi:MAG: ATP-binding cassette domain-containing protein [Candidatus Methanomethylophilaceae archaeon]|nr:ATP-binding cassette domain-containing protein [Candidatus Methanomethylophilaceae archaeon]